MREGRAERDPKGASGEAGGVTGAKEAAGRLERLARREREV